MPRSVYNEDASKVVRSVSQVKNETECVFCLVYAEKHLEIPNSSPRAGNPRARSTSCGIIVPHIQIIHSHTSGIGISASDFGPIRIDFYFMNCSALCCSATATPNAGGSFRPPAIDVTTSSRLLVAYSMRKEGYWRLGTAATRIR